MRIAGALQVLLCVCLVVGWSGLEARADQALATTHKAAHGSETLSGGLSSTRSPVVLRPADVDLVKSRPGGGLNRSLEAVRLERRISARSAVVVDPVTGSLLFALNPDKPRQPASTIKVLTGLIAMQSLRDSELVPASARAAGMPRSKIYLQTGRSYRAGDLINATLIRSANDASVALAERIAGNEATFARLMTSKARFLGATNTVIRNSNGLTARGQQSTARDLAIIFHRAMQNPEFARRIGSTTVPTNFGQTLRTNNRALWEINGTAGGKTGYTRAARQTYVGKFERGNRQLIVSLMGSNSMWDDLVHLVEYGFRQLDNDSLRVEARVDSAFIRRDPGLGSLASGSRGSASRASGSSASGAVLSEAAKSGL